MRKHIEYYDTEQETYGDYWYDYPSDLELLDVFPEAKSIIPEKIHELTRKKGKLLCKETIPFFKKANALNDELSREFWKLVYYHFAGRMQKILTHLKRLKRLQSMLNKPKVTEDFEKLKESAKQKPIVDLHDFQKLKKVGRKYVALCPFHEEKTPSFYIFEDNGFKCFGCGESGDSIAFLQKLKGYSFPEAVSSLGGAQ